MASELFGSATGEPRKPNLRTEPLFNLTLRKARNGSTQKLRASDRQASS